MSDAQTPQANPVGRPPKLTQEFLAAAYEVINHDQNALIYTDEDLLFLINEKLTPEGKISKSTFEKWKAGKIGDDVEGEQFLRLIARALLRQKEDLFKKFQENGETAGPWQRTAWIIERKFTEWNLKKNIGIEKTEDGAAALAAALLGVDESDEEELPEEVAAEPAIAPKKGKGKDT
jgi:hypothetical protein